MSVMPQQAWTIDDVDALNLPEGSRVEILDGSLIVTPAPQVSHQWLLKRLDTALSAQLPKTLTTLQGVGVGTPQSYLIPDLVVVTLKTAQAGGRLIDPQLVLLAVEVVSESTRTTDYVTKTNRYQATWGINRYWLLDPARRRLVDHGFAQFSEGALAVSQVGAVHVTIDLDEVFE